MADDEGRSCSSSHPDLVRVILRHAFVVFAIRPGSTSLFVSTESRYDRSSLYCKYLDSITASYSPGTFSLINRPTISPSLHDWAIHWRSDVASMTRYGAGISWSIIMRSLFGWVTLKVYTSRSSGFEMYP